MQIKNSKKYFLLLDFDGVICDTLNECLETSYEAYKHFNSNLPSFPKKKWRKAFIANRKLVRPPKNFYPLWHLITKGKLKTRSIKSFEDISRRIKNINFCKKFFKIRKNKIKNFPLLFKKNNPLYPSVLSSWGKLESKALIFIISTKDNYSIKKIMSMHHLKAKKIFANIEGSKINAINKIIKTHKISKKNIFFVDDNASHLRDVQKIGVNLILAKWGYGPSSFANCNKISSFSQLIPLLKSYQ